MATINLGKVAPVYKGTYVAGTYQKYEVVFDGESSFISLVDNNVTALANDGTHWLYLCRGNYIATAAQDAAILSAAPLITYVKRLEADTATQLDKTAAANAFNQYLTQLPETVLLFNPQCGLKERTSGSNKYISKMYSLKGATYDAAQATDATQPYSALAIAPNAKKGIKYLGTQTQTGLLDFTDKAFLTTDAWSLSLAIKSNKRGSATRVYFGASYLAITDTQIILHNGTDAVLTGTHAFICGRTAIIGMTYSNGLGLIKVDGVPIVTVAAMKDITFGQISGNLTYPFDGTIYHMHLTNTQKSEYQSSLDYNFLRAIYPDIEGVNIGNQHWATSNYEGVIDAIGTVIPEVQSASTSVAPELIVNGGFDSATGWSIVGESTISDGVARIYSSTGVLSSASTNAFMVIGKRYLLKYDVIASVLGSISISNFINTLLTDISVGVNKTFEFTATETIFYLKRASACDVTFDNISIKEVGWADLTTPAWCYYNNDPALGAVYGKLYNHYAVDTIAANPPSGWRVPTLADVTQLSNYLGGDTVSGGKIKARYGGFLNSFSTNESGFSLIETGRRADDGIFDVLGSYSYIWCSNSQTAFYAKNSDLTLAYYYTISNSRGYALRLIRTSPVGSDVQKLTTGVFTTDITSTYKLLNIPFGYQVTAIKVKCDSNVTNFECKMYNYAGSVLQATLVTGKTATANVPIKFGVVADSPIQYQDAQLRFTCAKAVSTANLEIGVVIEKIL